MSEYEVDPYDAEVEREQIRELNEAHSMDALRRGKRERPDKLGTPDRTQGILQKSNHVLDLQSRTWRNLWWSIGLLVLLGLALFFAKVRAIWQ